MCLDITRLVMQKQQAGMPAPQIRGDIDARYGRMGKPMPTPLPK